LIPLPASLSELTGPVYGQESVTGNDADLTRNGRRNGEPLGERIIVAGKVLDGDGRPVPNTLVEVWQANACGRYIHEADQHDAPIDPNFFGGGRCVTDANGVYRFLTIKPGAYPWGNHANAWRPNHIHFSLFGGSFASRLVTQMYFPGDPLLDLDPIFLATPPETRHLLVSKFTLDLTEPNYALGYEFNIVLRGRHATPMEA
jgi:protocatechuate 3,4-dioxygenase beta subunit